MTVEFYRGDLSEAACVSSYATKNITSGEGGGVVTNSEDSNTRLLLLRQHGMSASAADRYTGTYRHWDLELLDCVVEIKGSYKIGKYMPGTLVPVVDEGRLFEDQPEYALLLSWHIADELIPKLSERGFMGRYIVPLPEPRIVEGI